MCVGLKISGLPLLHRSKIEIADKQLFSKHHMTQTNTQRTPLTQEQQQTQQRRLVTRTVPSCRVAAVPIVACAAIGAATSERAACATIDDVEAKLAATDEALLTCGDCA